MPDHKIISSTSQTFLDIYDITNNIVILKNGSTAIILTVNAMNFGLLAEQEQDTVIYSYARLLNSINYPIQILIQSQTKDVSAYLKLLDNQTQLATDQVKKNWIKRYSQFVSDLIKERNVLDKKFYVIIPANAIEMGLEPMKSVLPGMKTYSIENVEKSVILEKAQNLLEPKRDHLTSQFSAIGLYSRQLNTQEIIQLFYTNYNPEATEGQQITDSQSYTTALVQAQIQGVNMDDQTSTPTPVVDPTPTPVSSNNPVPESVKPQPQPIKPTPPAVGESPITAPPTPPTPPTVSPHTPVGPTPPPVMPAPTAPIVPPTPPQNEVNQTPPTPTPPNPTADVTPVQLEVAAPAVATPSTVPPTAPIKPATAQTAINDTVKKMNN